MTRPANITQAIGLAADRRRERGVVLVITLLALLLLVALLLYVLNLSDQVDRRIQTQNAADSSAIAGATWMARSLNTVAENNVTNARHIAAINVLDSMPLAARFALTEQTAMGRALEAQLGRGVGMQPARLMDEVRQMLDDLLDQIEFEVEQLEPVDQMFQSIDVREMTWYRAPNGGNGQIWRAMMALDEVNQAVMENFGDLALLTAHRGGRQNLPGGSWASQAMLVPLDPQIPHQRGEFADFEQPVKYGFLPDELDDPVERRGPWDTVFGWHAIRYDRVGGTWVPGTNGGGPGWSNPVPIGSSGPGGGSGGHWSGGSIEPINYYTWGPQRWLLDRVRSFWQNHFWASRLNWWVDRMANAKLQYLWPGNLDTDGNPPDRPDTYDPESADPVQLVEPDWIIDFDQAMQTIDRDRDRVREIAFFVMEIKSRYPSSDSRFMSEGSWAPFGSGRHHQPHISRRRYRNSLDPRTWSVDKIADHGWLYEHTYQVRWDLEIGLQPIEDNELQDVYFYGCYYFAGINVGEPVEVDNPYQGFDPKDADAPAPMNIDVNAVATDTEARRQYLTVLGVARQRDEAEGWPSAFAGRKPYPNMVGIAQARVFNNHSWDAWTPMWHAQLEPVSDFDRWIDQLDEGFGQSANLPALDAEEVELMREHLAGLRELAPVMLAH